MTQTPKKTTTRKPRVSKAKVKLPPNPFMHEILELAERLPSRLLPEIVALARRQRCRNVLAAVTMIFRRALGGDVLPQISVNTLGVDRTRMTIHEALFLPRGTSHIDPLSPLPRRSKWIEEIRAYLLADTVNDVVLDFVRMAQIHYHARWPTRIRSGGL